VAADLTIIIPSHCRVDLLRACLTSVIQHAPPRTEILVVDDGSPGACVQSLANQFSNIGCLRLPEQRGFACAANAGINAASSPIVELLNDDTEVTRGWAEAALAPFKNPRVASVAPLVLRWPGLPAEAPRIDSAGDHYYLAGIARKRHHGQRLDQLDLTRRRVFGASASSAFYRRKSVVKVGGFPESFGAYFEDVDLSFRLNRAGYLTVFEPASQVLHHVGASHGRPQGRFLEQQSRNEERVFWRNVPTPLLLGLAPAHLALLLAKAWRRWREGNLQSFLRGRVAVIAEADQIRQHRKTVRTRSNLASQSSQSKSLRTSASV
jgi:GT2 family glycosyltransferase